MLHVTVRIENLIPEKSFLTIYILLQMTMNSHLCTKIIPRKLLTLHLWVRECVCWYLWRKDSYSGFIFLIICILDSNLALHKLHKANPTEGQQKSPTLFLSFFCQCLSFNNIILKKYPNNRVISILYYFNYDMMGRKGLVPIRPGSRPVTSPSTNTEPIHPHSLKD